MRNLNLIRYLMPMLLVVLSGCVEQVSFSQQVMPILEAKCLACHAEGAAGYEASGFSVESHEQVMKGTRNGPVVEPGYSYASTLQTLVEHKADPSIAMPQNAPKLSSAEIQTIGEWIDQGAKNN